MTFKLKVWSQSKNTRQGGNHKTLKCRTLEMTRIEKENLGENKWQK